jgi:hypothetical protein
MIGGNQYKNRGAYMARNKSFIIFLSLILTLSYCSRAFAIYMWVDDKGETHISDLPRPMKPQKEQPSDAETAGKTKVSGSPGKSLDAGHAPVTGEMTKLITAPVPSVVPLRNEPAVAVQTQQQQAGLTTTQATPTLTLTPIPVPADPGHEPSRNIPPNAPRSTAQDNTAVAKVISTFFSMFLIALILAYFYFSLCLYLIARKLNVPAAWVAWIPIIQVWTFLATAGKPGWWALLFLVPVVNLIIQAYLWMCIVENLGREKWLGLLILVPIVNVVYLGILAFSGSDGSSNRTAAVS